MVYISADGATGGEYCYETAKDIGKAVATHLDIYYPDKVKNPDVDVTEM